MARLPLRPCSAETTALPRSRCELWTAGAQLAVVRFDDFELADLLGVTVVAQSTAEMGRIAAELLSSGLAATGARRSGS
jgi:DNA-binding LacI/PurR family transcriptional regulator